LESELFGHEKGSFTGADRQRIGKFEQCNGGTIFLDEIGDMPSSLQSKILRLLQQREFQRVGGNETITTNVRIVAATNRDLEQMVADGDYRKDLLYRLNGYTINLPPLRKRGDDLVLLIQHLLARIASEINREVEGIAPATLDALKAYSWPGNVRELEGVLRQTLLQATGTVIAPEYLPAAITNDFVSTTTTSVVEEDTDDESRLPYNLKRFIKQRLDGKSTNVYAESLEMMERFLLNEILTLADGNQSETARILGITRGSLRHKIRSLGISIESKVDPGE
jgi:two-component system nitrogen regulation response regulator GlnG